VVTRDSTGSAISHLNPNEHLLNNEHETI